MSAYPPADDRLRHLIAQELNLSVDTWKFAFWLATNIVNNPEVRKELQRVEAAHAAGDPCGDRNCRPCWDARLTTANGGAA